MNILAIDAATKTGWAMLLHDQITSGIEDFSKRRGESNGILFMRFNQWLANKIVNAAVDSLSFQDGVFGLDLLVFEQAHHRGGAPTEIGVGLMTRVLEAAARHKIEHAPIHSMTLKKWSTGSGKAQKSEMIEAANKVIFPRRVFDDNEADAVLLLCYAMEKFGGSACNVPVAKPQLASDTLAPTAR